MAERIFLHIIYFKKFAAIVGDLSHYYCEEEEREDDEWVEGEVCYYSFTRL